MTVTNSYLQGNYAPVSTEETVTDLAVTGALPHALNGRYLRNGPNPIAPPDAATYHWFTGDGMVHGIRIGDGRPVQHGSESIDGAGLEQQRLV